MPGMAGTRNRSAGQTMTDEVVLPKRIALLGDALRPVLDRLKFGLDEDLSTTTSIESMIDVCRQASIRYIA